MNGLSPKTPHQGGWNSAMRAWAIAGFILCCTCILIQTQNVTPQEWMTEITFVSAHLLANEVIASARH
jgi:hypothetical protein